jgi:hypothetical protein
MGDILSQVFIFGMFVGTCVGLVIGATAGVWVYRRDSVPCEPLPSPTPAPKERTGE